MLPSLSAREYTITAVFVDSLYSRAEDNSTISINKGTIHIEAESIIISDGEPAVLTAKIFDSNNKVVDRATKVTVKINGLTFISEQTVQNGIINLTLNQSIDGKTSVDNFKLNRVYDILIIAGENNHNKGANTTAILLKTE